VPSVSPWLKVLPVSGSNFRRLHFVTDSVGDNLSPTDSFLEDGGQEFHRGSLTSTNTFSREHTRDLDEITVSDSQSLSFSTHSRRN
jgi:hypothetical protein